MKYNCIFSMYLSLHYKRYIRIACDYGSHEITTKFS